MCLYANSKSEIITAKEDMVVFKCLDERRKGRYFAPIRPEYEYIIGQSYRLADSLNLINDYGYYCYVNEESVIKDFAIFNKNDIIAKFIIPEGSQYYTGTFNREENKAIVSDAVVFDSIVGYPLERAKKLNINLEKCTYFSSKNFVTLKGRKQGESDV